MGTALPATVELTAEHSSLISHRNSTRSGQHPNHAANCPKGLSLMISFSFPRDPMKEVQNHSPGTKTLGVQLLS